MSYSTLHSSSEKIGYTSLSRSIIQHINKFCLLCTVSWKIVICLVETSVCLSSLWVLYLSWVTSTSMSFKSWSCLSRKASPYIIKNSSTCSRKIKQTLSVWFMYSLIILMILGINVWILSEIEIPILRHTNG